MIGATITPTGTPAARELRHCAQPGLGRGCARLQRACQAIVERGDAHEDMRQVLAANGASRSRSPSHETRSW